MARYDDIAEKYHEWRQKFDNSEQFELFSEYLPQNARVLDLGCGSGIPVSKFLVEKGYDVTGVDISPKMIELARKNVSDARFVVGDMTEVRFKKKFDGVIAVYSIFHVPREEQKKLFERIHSVLFSGGVFLASLATDEGEYEHDYFGVPVFWSHYSSEKYKNMIGEKFEILYENFVDTGGEINYWILAKKV